MSASYFELDFLINLHGIKKPKSPIICDSHHGTEVPTIVNVKTT